MGLSFDIFIVLFSGLEEVGFEVWAFKCVQSLPALLLLNPVAIILLIMVGVEFMGTQNKRKPFILWKSCSEHFVTQVSEET